MGGAVMKMSHGSDDFSTMAASFYDLNCRRLASEEVDQFDRYRNKVVLAVNVASA